MCQMIFQIGWTKNAIKQNDLEERNYEHGRGVRFPLACATIWVTGIHIVRVKHAMAKQCPPQLSFTTGKEATF